MVLILDVYSKKNLCSSEHSHKNWPHTAQAYYSSDLKWIVSRRQAILYNHSFKSSYSSTRTLRNIFSQLTGRNYGPHEETAVNSMHLVYSIKVKTAEK